jgi:DNA-binding PadR family transcriptional regulator
VAKSRRVGNLLALAVLSALVEKPMHPYEMATTLRERGKDQDMPIKWGSLYTVVGNLEKHGLIEATGSDRQGARPERTVYALTAEGKTELVDWTRELIAEPETELPRFKAGLSMMAVLGPGESVRLLQQRLEVLEKRLAAQREALAEVAGQLPRVFWIEMEYDVALRAAETGWVRAVLTDLEAGTFGGQDGWQEQWQAWVTQNLPPAGPEGGP